MMAHAKCFHGNPSCKVIRAVYHMDATAGMEFEDIDDDDSSPADDKDSSDSDDGDTSNDNNASSTKDPDDDAGDDAGNGGEIS